LRVPRGFGRTPGGSQGCPLRVLLTGGSGFVGRHLHSADLAGGHEVVLLKRGSALEPGVLAAPGELAEITPAGWPGAIDAVVHLAAANPERGAKGSGDLAFLRRVNRDGTAALAHAAAESGVTRFVFVSTANIHAPSDAPISETSPVSPQNPYAASKAEGEEALWAALDGSGVEGCVLRPAPVFGPDGRGALALLIRLARSSAPLPLGSLTARRSILSVDHLVAALLRALEADEAAGGAFLVADPDPLSPAEIVAAVRQGTGRSPGVFPLPVPVLTGLARLAGRGEALAGLRRPFVLDTRRVRDRLGWEAASDAGTALAHMGAS